LQPSAEFPAPLPALRHARGWAWRSLGQWYLKLAGWKVEGAFPEASKCVIIVAPHTSNWDFTLGLAVVFTLEMRVSWLGKHTLFQPPFRKLLRWLGGIPVDRRASHGVVGACVEAFQTEPALMLALPPGTAITTILGTNKVVACTGTTFAAGQFLHAKVIRWQEMVGPVLAAMAGAGSASHASTCVNAAACRIQSGRSRRARRRPARLPPPAPVPCRCGLIQFHRCLP